MAAFSDNDTGTKISTWPNEGRLDITYTSGTQTIGPGGPVYIDYNPPQEEEIYLNRAARRKKAALERKSKRLVRVHGGKQHADHRVLRQDRSR